jgi:hypothetical protein
MNRMHKTTLALLIGASISVAQAQMPASEQRLNDVAERGRHVMPFHLEKTRHVFNKTEHGGLQQVIAKNADDSEQIGLIRQHLADISERFKHGDFSKQRRIHGDDMPGLLDLIGNYPHISFNYRELPNGAEIAYVAEDSMLIDAIHRYFNAQLSDHARHGKHRTHKHLHHHADGQE